MSEILVQYQGFHPSDFTRAYLDTKLNEIQDQAPYGATVRAVFTRKNKTFTASVRILSAAGHFFASASGVRMRDVSHKLNDRLRKQLRRWKAIRFDRRSLRDLPVVTRTTLERSDHDSSVA